jgi:hypothetical protein
MAQHGYLHDSYDRDDFGRGDDHREEERSWRGRDHDEQSRWRGPDSDWNQRDRDRSSMFGGWQDHDRQSGGRNRESGRGFFERTKDEASEWFGGEPRGRGQWEDRSRQSGDWARGRAENSAFTSPGQSGQRYSAHPDDHYRSWRDKQMQALDRDYQDYCREREQQFHSDFDTWRQNRQGEQQGQTQAGSPSNESLELDQVANVGENDASAPSATGRDKR